MDNKTILLALASDLKRVTLGIERGATDMAMRFGEEALQRKQEIDRSMVARYIGDLLDSIDQVLSQKDLQKKAEDALMY
ncbi:MAG: hypothetical protein AAB649_05125, partial [Patescibacteria group bacterium]